MILGIFFISYEKIIEYFFDKNFSLGLEAIYYTLTQDYDYGDAEVERIDSVLIPKLILCSLAIIPPI